MALTSSKTGHSTMSGMAAIDRPAFLMTSIARDILFARKQKRKNHNKANT